MRSLVLIAATLTAAVSGFAVPARAEAGKCEPQALATKYPSLVGKTIRVAQDGQGPPYTMHDPEDFEQLIGLDADLVRAAFACIGVPVVFKTGQWSGMLPSVIAGQADLMWNNLYYTPPRAEQVDFVTYLLAATGAIVKKGNPKNIHALGDICGLHATAGLGTVEEASFRATSEKCVAAGKDAVEIFTYPDKPSGIRMIQTGRADIMMSDDGGMRALVKASPNDFELAFSILTDYKVGPGISKSQPELRQAIFDAMTILQADGTQKALMIKYGVNPDLQRPVQVFTK